MVDGTLGNLVSVILGAVLAIVTSFVAQIVAEWREEKKRRRRLKRILYSELMPCIECLTRFAGDFKTKHEPEPALLFALERSLLLFEKERSDIYLLDAALDRRLVGFFDRASRSVEVLREMLKVAGSGGYERWARERIYTEVEALGLLVGEGMELVKTLRLPESPAKAPIKKIVTEVNAKVG